MLANREISNEYLYEMLETTRLACQDINLSPTFFEGITAAAFLAFSQVAADILILEVGLGGRLDATNVITPAISVITPSRKIMLSFLEMM